jgi:hypothetical protein
MRRRNSSRLRCRKHLADGGASDVELDREPDRGKAGLGQPRRLSDLGMSASPPTPDVSLQGNEPTLRANNGHEQLFEDLVSAAPVK